ncbi:hypothetical protein [Agrobacterium sp. ICMP 6402]|uniref:glycine-rich domain-containing protein n=1 Tax=Agrobacterium sp. ICMP 6402 TaxID=2292443 RepID=UPI00129771CA|nr:hypothetical protein [Agrobacterium sp. ICMP 6402]
MATNQYLPFGTAGGANVLTPSAYNGLAARLSGFTAGTAVSAQLNTVWRQSSVISAMMGEFILDYGGYDALDDGNVDTLENSFVRTLQKQPWLFAAVGGTANALTMTLSPVPTSWADLVGTPLRGIITTTNTGACTLNVNGLGAVPIVSSGANALLKGQLLAGTAVTFVYDGTNAQVSTPLAVRFATDVTVYNTAGSGTYTVPAGVTRILVEIWGGGGGGGGASNMANEYCGTGGAGGGYTRKIIDVTPGQTLAYTVGAAGTGGATGGSGTSGGTTSFGGILSATGGSPGVHGKFAVIGNITTGGVGTGGDINLIGGFGTGALPAAPNGTGVGGAGGGTPFGAPSGVQSAGPNIAGVWPGGGGGGSGGTGGAAGLAGAAGGIIIQIIN